MTNEETLKNMDNIENIVIHSLSGYPYTEEEKLLLVVLDKCREALEKQIPKKPFYIRDVDALYFDWQCPHCKREYRKAIIEVNNCHDCGQSIGWSDDE